MQVIDLSLRATRTIPAPSQWDHPAQRPFLTRRNCARVVRKPSRTVSQPVVTPGPVDDHWTQSGSEDARNAFSSVVAILVVILLGVLTVVHS
jgi:hypothetical protein